MNIDIIILYALILINSITSVIVSLRQDAKISKLEREIEDSKKPSYTQN